VPGAIEDAAGFLKEHAETRERFEQVTKLVEGFESPFGLELLATVHWVMKHEQAGSVDEVVRLIHAWNERKLQFTPRQIGLAVDVLSQKGWVNPH